MNRQMIRSSCLLAAMLVLLAASVSATAPTTTAAPTAAAPTTAAPTTAAPTTAAPHTAAPTTAAPTTAAPTTAAPTTAAPTAAAPTTAAPHTAAPTTAAPTTAAPTTAAPTTAAPTTAAPTAAAPTTAAPTTAAPTTAAPTTAAPTAAAPTAAAPTTAAPTTAAAPTAPAPAVPSVPTTPIAPLAPQVTVTVPSVAPNAVVTTPLISPSPTGSTLVVTWSVNGVNGQSATQASFGGSDCSTTQCRAFRAALATAAGVNENQVTITSVNPASAKFEVLAVNVGTSISATSSQAALQALVNLQARAANGNLGSGVGAALTGASATPVTPPSPPVPSAPLAPSGPLNGPLATFNVYLRTSLASFNTTDAQLAYRRDIYRLFDLAVDTTLNRVQIRGTPKATTVKSKKFSVLADGVIVDTSIQPSNGYASVLGIALNFMTAVALNNSKIAGFDVVDIQATNVPNAAIRTEMPVALMAIFTILAALAAFL